MPPLKWTDANEIAFQLKEKFPELDPLTVRFTDLRKWVTQLEQFEDSGQPDENILEAIQMAWVEHYGENR